MKTLFLLFVLILWHDVLTSTKESRNWSSKKKKSWSRLTDKGFVLNKPGFLSEEQFTLPNSKWNTVLILTWILSLRFNGHYSGWTWVSRYQNISSLDFVGAKGVGGGGENWSYKMFKPPVKMSPPTNQYPIFYRLRALPVAQPTRSDHWRKSTQFFFSLSVLTAMQRMMEVVVTTGAINRAMLQSIHHHQQTNNTSRFL